MSDIKSFNNQVTESELIGISGCDQVEIFSKDQQLAFVNREYKQFIDESIALMLASKAEDSEDSDEKLDLALAEVSKKYDEMLAKQEAEKAEQARRREAEDEGQIYTGRALAYHEQLEAAEECFNDTSESGTYGRIRFITSQDLHAIVAQISEANPQAANLLSGLDLNRITSEITEEFLNELPRGNVEQVPITVGSVLTEIFGIHSAYAGSGVIQGLNAAAKTPYGKKIIEKLLQHAGSALKSEAVKQVVDNFYSGVDDIADYFNKPFEKAKADNANKNKVASQNHNIGQPIGSGGGQLPEDPDEEEKGDYRGKSGIKQDEYLVKKDPNNPDQKIKNLQWDVKNSKDSKEIVRHNKYGKFYKDEEQKLNNSNMWWTKDIDEHGKSINKLYKQVAKGLEWIADVGEEGKIILDKHKSNASKFISWKELIKVK